jgi:carbamoyl-phosphate synthase/aspartate carbamoyltransferase/dihydroorotase
MSALVFPGIIDAHVHLRDPGAIHKEDALSGTVAALAGGVVGVLDMPNNTPPITRAERFIAKQAIFAAKAVADYGLFAGTDGTHLDDLVAMASQAAGLKLYLDETFGNLTNREPRALAETFEAWPGPGPIAVHAESASIPLALDLAERYGRHLHVCHVPHPDDLLVIDDARQGGINVTCEVTPHHLFLSHDALTKLGAMAQMKPPLVSPRARTLFWERLHLVDLIATDHAPHTRLEKVLSNPPPGVPGLETTLPLLLAAVEEGRLTYERFFDLVYTNPLRVYGLAAPASKVTVDLSRGRYRLPLDGYHTRCGWSPFAEQWGLGEVETVALRGQVIWRRDELLVAPGYGRPLVRTTE